MNSREELAVRVSHMSKWFTDQSYEATTLREVVEALRNGNAQRPLWQPIETAPKDRTWILVWETGVSDKYHPAEVARFVNNRWESSAMKYVEATHWMPIPTLTSTVSHDVEKTEDGAS